MKNLALLFFVFFIFNTLYSQDKKLEFTEFKNINEGYTVYINVVDLESEQQAEEILKDLLSIEGISWGRYFKSAENKDRFHLNISSNISPKVIQDVLLTHNTDFDYSNISVNGVILNPSNKSEQAEILWTPQTKIAEDFPDFEKTGKHDEDIENYRAKKDKWIQENSEEYNKTLKELEDNNKWREE